MDIFLPTAGIYLGINVLGLIWALGIVRWGLPDAIRLQDRPHPLSTVTERLPLVVLNVTILLTLTGLSILMIEDVFQRGPIPFGLLVVQILIILAFDDAWFYGWHRMLHENKWLYNKVHRIHHRAFSPLPYEYIYVHPAEWFVGTVGPIFGLALVGLIWGAIPAWTLWGYLIIRNLHELDIHSGVRSWIGDKIPLYGLTEHHDLHHSNPTKGNYASLSTLWDHVFSTLWRPEPTSAE